MGISLTDIDTMVRYKHEFEVCHTQLWLLRDKSQNLFVKVGTNTLVEQDKQRGEHVPEIRAALIAVMEKRVEVAKTKLTMLGVVNLPE